MTPPVATAWIALLYNTPLRWRPYKLSTTRSYTLFKASSLHLSVASWTIAYPNDGYVGWMIYSWTELLNKSGAYGYRNGFCMNTITDAMHTVYMCSVLTTCSACKACSIFCFIDAGVIVSSAIFKWRQHFPDAFPSLRVAVCILWVCLDSVQGKRQPSEEDMNPTVYRA